MGSHLAANGKRIWLSVRLVAGLDRLAYRADASDGVVPDGLLGATYDALLARLEQDFRTHPFAYDWRAPLEDAAQRLAEELQPVLERRSLDGAPVHFLTHGSGALVLRTLQLVAPETWDKLLADPATRLLMLGAPHRGFWAPMQILSGDDTFGNALMAFGTPFAERRGRQTFAGFPGLLQLQAAISDPELRLERAETWLGLATEDFQRTAQSSWWRNAGAGSRQYDWGLPEQGVLDRAAALRLRLDEQQAELLPRLSDRIFQVLGRARFTPDGFTSDQSGLLYLNAVDEGDGRTAKASAWLPGVSTWQADVEHGALCEDAKLFDAYCDLLLKGTTSRLPAAKSPVEGQHVAARLPSAPAEHQLDEARLILVGRGGAGKTSIVDRLLHDRFTEDRPATEGIDISQWRVETSARSIRVNVWDFAGQADTHASHQLFMSSGSVHLLVLASSADTQRRGEDVPRRDAEYWLRFIQARASTGPEDAAPVIVVCNQADQFPLSLDRDALRERYPFIVGFIDADCKSGRGIGALKDMLSRTLEALSLPRRGVPASWHGLREELESSQRSKSWLRYGDFQLLCADNGEQDPERQRAFADIFTQLGVALLFGRAEGLTEDLLVDPRWITVCLYRLMRAGPEPDRGASLSRERAACLLPGEPAYAVDFLLEVMRRFELLFETTDSSENFVVPQWLPTQPTGLAQVWQASGEMTRLRYRYPVMLEGLIPRFIARTHQLSEGLPRWSQGVVLQLGTARALVRTDELDRALNIAVAGDEAERRELLGVVCADLRVIHAALPGLEVVEELEVLAASFQPLSALREDEKADRPSGVATPRGTVTVNATEQLNRLTLPTARTPQRRARLFISYTSRDLRMRQALEDRLKPLAYTHGLIESVWTDHCIRAGDDWDCEVRAALARADVVILLVSARFLASDYIRGVEIAEALERARAGRCVVVPVILESMDAWETEAFGRMNALPPKGVPITKFRPQSDGWTAVARGMRIMLESRRAAPDVSTLS